MVFPLTATMNDSFIKFDTYSIIFTTVCYYLGVKGGGLFFQFFDFFLIPNGKV